LHELYERHAGLAAGICRLLLRDAGEAEDATQQTFLSAYRALLAGTVPREPAAWIAAIARNECRARIRMRMRTPLAPAAPQREQPDALTEAIERLDLRAVWVALGELPRRQRDAFLLREFGGLSYAELAAALGVSSSSVESLLVRARARLRAALASARVAFPTLARLLPWPLAAKVAATTVGAGLVVGGTFATSRGEGGPKRIGPAAVRRPAVTRRLDRPPPVAPARVVVFRAPVVAPHRREAAQPEQERGDATPAPKAAMAEPQDGGDGGDVSTGRDD